jgi:hypothetical protein
MNYRPLVLAACVASAGVVMAQDQMPHQKTGLWNVTVSLGTQKPGQEKICLDDATQKLMYQMGVQTSHSLCSQVSMHSTGSQFISESKCGSGNSAHTTRGVTTFTGDSAYHTEVLSHYDNPGSGHADSKSTIDGKWAGACPADMKPGDMVLTMEGLQQPMRMNLKDMVGK